MVDTEVENTLREIRERVVAAAAQQPPPPPPPRSERPTGAEDSLSTNGAGQRAASPNGLDALARLEANLATTERAWNKLPPLMSNRTGLAARLELWVKRQIKRATHWYTWEQINFNASVHHALRDALSTLRVYERALAQQQDLLQRALESRRAEIEAERSRVDAQLVAHAAQLRDALAGNIAQLRDEQNALAESWRSETQKLRDETHRESQSLRDEQRERIAHLLEEQRVCFRQLSLEAAETAVATDRARRDTEARLAELARRIEEMPDRKG